MENTAFDYGVSKSRICGAVKRAEKTLIKDGCFAPPSKRGLVKSDREMYAVIIDSAECGSERPKKQKGSCSGKKKRHTVKDRIVINGITKEINNRRAEPCGIVKISP
jgi:hypothetical protein